jgi:hypothetical protein
MEARDQHAPDSHAIHFSDTLRSAARGYEPLWLLFFNINTPDDYARAIDLDANS